MQKHMSEYLKDNLEVHLITPINDKVRDVSNGTSPCVFPSDSLTFGVDSLKGGNALRSIAVASSSTRTGQEGERSATLDSPSRILLDHGRRHSD
jgi:hypothetical protein